MYNDRQESSNVIVFGLSFPLALSFRRIKSKRAFIAVCLFFLPSMGQDRFYKCTGPLSIQSLSIALSSFLHN